MKGSKHLIELTVRDLVSSFLYYDRKGDEELELGYIEQSIASGEITMDEIISLFNNALIKGIKNGV